MSILPDGFADLEPWTTEWGSIENQQERYLHRQQQDMGTLRAFYDAAAGRLGAIYDHLDTFPVSEPLPKPEHRLYNVSLGLIEAAQAVEVYRQPLVPYAPVPHRVILEAHQN